MDAPRRLRPRFAEPARAQTPEHAARARTAVYQDDDATTVITSAVEAEAAAGEVMALRASYLVDAVTTASVDVVAAATERWDERRHDFGGGLDLYLGDVALTADVTRSLENDYDSWTASASGSVDLAGRATRLVLGAYFVDSDVGRQDDLDFHADQRIYAGDARIVQALTPELLGSLGYTLQHVGGYQASPYRYVPVGDGTFVRERHPRGRWRHALTGRLRHATTERMVLGFDQRLYADDWGILGSTTDLRSTIHASDEVDLVLHARVHYQSAATFWRQRYEQPRRFMSVDRELSTFADVYAGPAVVWTVEDAGPFDLLRFDVRADAFYFRFFDYAYLDGRVGTLASIGLEARL